MATVVLLLGTAVQAQTQETRRWRRVERSVALSAGQGAPVQRLRLAPGVVTTVLFDSDVALEAALPEELGGLFTRLDVTPNHLLLQPSVPMPETGVPPLVLHFTDAAAPQRLVLELVTEAGTADAVVDFRRRPATVEQLEAELAALRERNALLETRLATARRSMPEQGLAGAILSGAIAPSGVSSRWLRSDIVGVAWRVVRLDAYYTPTWMALAVELESPRDAAVLLPSLARLTPLSTDGQPSGDVQELPLLMLETRLLPGQRAVLVAQWRRASGKSPGFYALELLDSARRRSVRWARLKL
ncbi:DUF2381 family protein [Myxococcus sp. Y35]|uniref:DUF2381 family protein n=1 Tax=Pseudomyxococcus flavus TaxID=3115648 RepID=UPI003CF527E5